jgi:signal transduction histidine kinase
MSLQIAIYNLLLNACQAAMRSVDIPVVEVFLVEIEQWLYITILDNGPGIPASVRETLFDPFITMGKPNGTGLGLTLARRIADLNRRICRSRWSADARLRRDCWRTAPPWESHC